VDGSPEGKGGGIGSKEFNLMSKKEKEGREVRGKDGINLG